MNPHNVPNMGVHGQQRPQDEQHQQEHLHIPAVEKPIYDTANGGHYGASAAIANAGYAPDADSFINQGNGQFGNVGQGLQGTYKGTLASYWQNAIQELETQNHDYKQHHLPLARIKKVMKADPEVKMISAEAPILFAKGCDIFITELTMRAWIHAEENKRRTLQRSDIASALGRSDMFDFLIDIVPRDPETTRQARAPPAPQDDALVDNPVHSPQMVQSQMNQSHQMQQQQQHQHQQAQQQQAQHTMTPADYSLGHTLMGSDAEFRTNSGAYPGVPLDASASYGYGAMDNMYSYPGQAMYQVAPQRLQGQVQETAHNFRNHIHNNDPDADGDEDYDRSLDDS